MLCKDVRAKSEIHCQTQKLDMPEKKLWALGDGRHVVLGEDSAHAQLQDLLQHYTECPLSPYGEMLTQPLARQTSQVSRPKPPIPAKPQLPLEVYTRPAARPHRALPVNPIYQEPDEPIAFYAMGRGSPGEAPSNIYAE
ncbi:hypothetical protein STEG23_025065, partial [Scotinomys teguina]